MRVGEIEEGSNWKRGSKKKVRKGLCEKGVWREKGRNEYVIAQRRESVAFVVNEGKGVSIGDGQSEGVVV